MYTSTVPYSWKPGDPGIAEYAEYISGLENKILMLHFSVFFSVWSASTPKIVSREENIDLWGLKQSKFDMVS